MTIIDTHCHLDFEQFDSDRQDVVRRSKESGVEAMVLIGIDEDHWRSTANLSTEQSCMVRAAGFHPTSLDAEWSVDRIEGLEDELKSPDIVALGETGLDYYRDASNRSTQRDAFEAQLEVARKTGLPVIIHQRAAEDEVLEMLAAYAPLSGVMHCFGGDSEFARQFLDMGLYLGIGGIVTFKKADDVRDAVASVPLDRLLLETDAPFLAPHQWRGKRNEPAYLTDVVGEIARVKEIPETFVAETTTGNAVDLFGPRLAEAVSGGLGT